MPHMTNPAASASRSHVVRTIASTLVFDSDPAYIRTLDKARAAANSIADALVQNGILDFGDDGDAPAVNGNGAAEFAKHDPALPLEVS